MQKDTHQDLIDEIVSQSKKGEPALEKNISQLLDIYDEHRREILRLKKQNNYFTKQWDKKNLKDHERDVKKDRMLEQQSRLASMGEMIDAIAHQWKQPLNSFSMMSDMLKDDFQNSLVDEIYIEEFDSTVHIQIDYMVNTLSEFRNFFRPATKDENFNFQDIMESIQILMKDELLSQNIDLNIDIDEFLTIDGNINEFKHLFINLISNSIDAFNEKGIKERTIYIKSYEENDAIYIEVEDNAGGIPSSVLETLFMPNITTKAKGKGTGIGLYMSKQIVTKHHGTINVYNTKMGALFTITLH